VTLLKLIAVAVSLLAAVVLSLGVWLQNEAFDKRTSSPITGRMSFKNLKALFGRKRWLSGTGLIALASVLQVVSLSLAPLIVVQPVGAVALIVTALLNSRAAKVSITKSSWVAMCLSTLGIALFVSVAASVAMDQPTLSDASLLVVLGLLIGLLVLFLVATFTFAKKAKALSYIIGAGVLYGFVASLIKVVLQRIFQGHFEWLTILCAVALVGALLLGGWFVQNAYASGPPDLVIAGLTVIDPMVGVFIGIVVLGEATAASLLTIVAFIVSGALAVIGVWLLSKVHPELAKKA
jgi:drug/metabolite transporter (DMT)-like permease